MEPRLTIDYRVRLDAFEGPLDLLLYLIRRAEVDITDIPIAAIADQYMRYLGQIDSIDIELAGEFLVTAATLMEIKSRMLAPAPRPEGQEDAHAPQKPGEDPRAELVRQLLAYKQYRDAAEALDARKSQWERRLGAARAGVDDEALRRALEGEAAGVDLEDVSLVDLVEAFAEIEATVNFDRLGEHQVTYDDTPIELHAEDILDRLKREAMAGRVRLGLPEFFTGRSRGEMIGLFLAMLELVRCRAIRVRQEAPGMGIELELREPDPQEPAEATPDEPEPPRVEVVARAPESATDEAAARPPSASSRPH
jgi:segregation and condensation protein A